MHEWAVTTTLLAHNGRCSRMCREIGIGELLSLVQQNNEESMALTRFTSEVLYNTLAPW